MSNFYITRALFTEQFKLKTVTALKIVFIYMLKKIINLRKMYDKIAKSA